MESNGFKEFCSDSRQASDEYDSLIIDTTITSSIIAFVLLVSGARLLFSE